MPIPNPEFWLRLLLVFARTSGVLVAAPVFSHPSVNVRVRVLLGVLFSYAVVGVVPGDVPESAYVPAGLLLSIGIEAATGLLLGFAAQFAFLAVQYAGEVLGFQMGLSLAQAFDPATNASSNPLGRFLMLTLLTVFVLLDGHHQLLRALVGSFQVVPLAGAQVQAGGPLLLEWTGAFMATALRLAAPFMVTIFLVDTALGVFARVAPQADLFAISLPLKLVVGLGLAYAFMQVLIPYIPLLIDRMFSDVLTLIEAMGGG